MFVASKYEDIYPPMVADFEYICDGQYVVRLDACRPRVLDSLSSCFPAVAICPASLLSCPSCHLPVICMSTLS
jgi:hypothetical protein